MRKDFSEQLLWTQSLNLALNLDYRVWPPTCHHKLCMFGVGYLSSNVVVYQTATILSQQRTLCHLSFNMISSFLAAKKQLQKLKEVVPCVPWVFEWIIIYTFLIFNVQQLKQHFIWPKWLPEKKSSKSQSWSLKSVLKFQHQICYRGQGWSNFFPLNTNGLVVKFWPI